MSIARSYPAEVKPNVSRGTNAVSMLEKKKKKNSSLYNKTAMQSKTPTMTDLINVSALWTHRDELPDVVEFEDGASDVPFMKVSFLPRLHDNSIK